MCLWHKYVCAHFDVNVDAHTHIFPSCMRISAQIFTKFFLVVHHSAMSLSLKFHKDPSKSHICVFKVSIHTRACFCFVCTHICVRIFLVVCYSVETLSFKFHKYLIFAKFSDAFFCRYCIGHRLS